MATLLTRLFAKKTTFRPQGQPQSPMNIPPPKLIETAHLYDYIDFMPTIENTRREYLFTVVKYKELKRKLKRLEDEQFEAVLEGRVTADESFRFTDKYEDLREQVKYLDNQRKTLRKKVREAKKRTFPIQRSAVYYPPL